jgi:DNA-binding transcriptional regulator YhcF (GntR family)
VPDAAPGRSTSAGDPALPITRRAAFSRAICPAMLPTAAATPDTKTVSPARSWAMSSDLREVSSCRSYLLCYAPSYMTEPIIEFHLDAGSGLPPYQQLVRQVRQALRLGLLREGDQLPTVKEVVALLAINPNTVLKAYRELEYGGLVAARPGVGTFVTRTLADATLAAHAPLRRDLVRWLAKARLAGLDDESIEALFMTTFRTAAQEDVA